MGRTAANGLVVTRTPLRVSLAGGGTDLPAYYEHADGAVLSTAIDKYVYVTLKRHDALFESPIRLNYSETEQVTRVEEIRNEIARACFSTHGMDAPIYMSTVADIPAASGLGSSSAFCVGLLHALYAFRGEHPSAGQLAEEAAHIEMDVLGRPVGKQDHYAAAYGGINLFRFQRDGGVSVEPLRIGEEGRDKFFAHAMLFWTGQTRSASKVLAEQREKTPQRWQELTEMRDAASRLRRAMSNGFHARDLGESLDRCWHLKKKLASTISNDRLDAWYRSALDAGAFGGKICGAGGGGFFLFLVAPERREAVREALADLREIPVGFEAQGSRLMLPQVE
jgi:D-glycero-alpha-D-manno-heptose-7-phosphate kinase